MPIKCMNQACPYCQQGECGRRSQNDHLHVVCSDRLIPPSQADEPKDIKKDEVWLDEAALFRYIAGQWGETGVLAMARLLRRGKHRD